MARSDLQELYVTVRSWLTANVELWTEVYPDVAPNDAILPYVVMFYMGGGDVPRLRRDTPSLVLGVKCVAADMDTSMRGAKRLRELLDDVEDTSGIRTGQSWYVLNGTAEQIIHTVEPVDGGYLYHDGNKYRFELEEL